MRPPTSASDVVAPNLPLPDDASAAPALAAEYAAARERTGKVMAILRAMGPRVEVVRAFLALADAALYGPASLGRRERELLAVATSEANAAQYSVAVHTRLLAELGGARNDARDAALVAFARRLTLAPADAGQAVAALRAVLADDEVHDAIAVVGLLNFANRVALATGISEADDLSDSP
jgi:AhpD family alkylhydroperoxidase